MLLFMDGFDKYGGVNNSTTSVAALLAGEWGTITAWNIVAPLSATGQAASAAGASTLTKTLASSYGRLIGGFRFSSLLGAACGLQFLDGASAQTGIGIATTGIISLRSGTYNTGTILGSGATPISANATHYLEWDITFGASAAYNVYLDGVLIISGTGHTTATANNSASGISLLSASGANDFNIDDLYLFDSTGSTNNAPLLNSPRIETTFPTSDSAVQFSIGASVLGSTVARAAANFPTTANQFYLRAFTPARACTLNSITFSTGTGSSGTINLRPIVYADSAGAPGTLMSAGSTVTGITASATLTMPLTTPQSLSAGTQYWLGFMCDVALSNAFQESDSGAAGRTATSTFASGAPGTAPATTAGQASALLWGNITLSSPVNYYEVSQSPPPAAGASYVLDSTVGHEDLYGFNALSVLPANLYAVSVKAFCARSDSGARTVSMRVHSGSTDSGGSLTGQTPGTSQGWIASNFETDPNGGIAWTGPNLNAATSGFRIDA